MLQQWYRNKTILVTGADKPLSVVVVREVIRRLYPEIKKLYLLVAEGACSGEYGVSMLELYAKERAFSCLYQDDNVAWFKQLLEAKSEVLCGSGENGATLGLGKEAVAALQQEVDVILHCDGLADPCDVDVDASAIHKSGMGIAAFASKCEHVILALPGSLQGTAVGRRFRNAPLDYSPAIPEDPATGIRAVEEPDEGMPSPLTQAVSIVESAISNMATQGGTSPVAVVRHGFIGPPIDHPSDSVLYGGFDALSLSISLGTVSSVKLSPSSLVDLMPADVFAERLISSPLLLKGDQRVAVHHASTSTVHPLALKMVGQYFTEYFGRNHKALTVCLDYGVPASGGSMAPIRVPLSPVLSQSPSLHVGIRGTAAMAVRSVIPWYRKTQNHLTNHPHAASASRYRDTVEKAKKMTPLFVRGVAASQKSFVSSTCILPGGTDIREVEWEMYCKDTARQSFLHLCRVLGVQANNVPVSAKYCDMDHLTCHPGMSFSAPVSILQRMFPDLHFLVTCTRQFDGKEIIYRPGLTAARRAFIMSLPSVTKAIEEQAKKERVDREAIIERAHAILDRVGDKLNVNTIRFLGIGLRKVMQTLYEHVHVNQPAYEMVRRAFTGIGSIRPTGRRAIVLIPSHRSYMDFLVVSYLMYMWGLPVPHICAGEDFLKLNAVSKLLRGSGAFFMRRSFKGDQLYGTLFREYSRLLATDGRVIEFFIEGARSRMGKTLAPKVGILKIMVESLLEAVASNDTSLADVLFVPVSLSYDKVLEGSIYVRELTGGKKPPETISNLLSAASVLRNQFGTLNVTVGKPISLAEYVIKGDGGSVSTSLPSLGKPAALIKDKDRTGESEPYNQVSDEQLREAVRNLTPKTSKQLLNTLAWRITANLQTGLIVTPTALLAAVLLYLHLPSDLERGIHVDEVVSEVVWLREQVLKSGGHMKPGTIRYSGEALLNYAVFLLDPYVTVSSLNVIRTQDSDTLLLLSIYANQLIHLFCDRSMVVITATAMQPCEILTLPQADSEASITARKVPVEGLLEEVEFVRNLFSLEFPNHRDTSPVKHDVWFRDTVRQLERDGARVDGPSVVVPTDTLCSGFIASLLHPLVECYWLVAAALMHLVSASKVPEPQFMERVATSVEHLLCADVVHFPNSCNREVLKLALTRYKEMGLVSHGQALTLPFSMTKDNGSVLLGIVERIDKLRWKPSTKLAEDIGVIARSMQEAKL